MQKVNFTFKNVFNFVESLWVDHFGEHMDSDKKKC